MEKVVFSLGSNKGDRAKNLRLAEGHLQTLLSSDLRTSSLYETSPVDYLDQPNFYNTVAVGVTNKSPLECLDICDCIPKIMGSDKPFKFGPRLIDVDLILYGELVFKAGDVCIPHERFRQRLFVLVPMVEVAPYIKDPVSKRAAFDLALEAEEACHGQRITKVNANSTAT